MVLQFINQKGAPMATIWKIAPGEHANNWDICRTHGCIVIGWEIGDYQNYRSEKDILKALKKEFGKRKGCGTGAARTIWRFVHVVENSDVVVANKGARTVVGIGRIVSEYLHPENPRNPVPAPGEGEWWRRQRAWLIGASKSRWNCSNNFFVASTIQRLTPEQCDEIRKAYHRQHPELDGRLDDLFSGDFTSADNHLSATKTQLAAVEKQLNAEGTFDPSEMEDDRERILSSLVVRRGQPAFRRHLLRAYKSRCAITGCDVEAVLEAAHIVPYKKGTKTDHPCNGLLLRADLHTLFDLGLMAVNVKTMKPVISPSLKGSAYESFSRKRIRLPKQPGSRPSLPALEKHCRECGLAQ